MEILQNNWKHWGKRLRLHVKENKLRWSTIADAMGVTEGTLRHWCNGQRAVNLDDFFQFCQTVNADPHLILFGKPHLTEESARQLGDQLTQLLTSDATLNPRYAAHSKTLRGVTLSVKQKSLTSRYGRAAKKQP